jgi:hypothetical protein
MRCSKFEAYLNDSLDPEEFKIHMKSCAHCQRAFQIDAHVLRQSKNLNEDLEIPDLWSDIEDNLQKKQPVILNFKKNKRLLFAAAASFLIITTLWLFGTFEKDSTSTRILSVQALEKVKKAEATYLEAIDDLEDLAYTQLEDTSEPLAQLYRNKLSLIDRQIQNCKDALEDNPANSHIRKYLLAALHDKQETLEEILRVNS